MDSHDRVGVNGDLDGRKSSMTKLLTELVDGLIPGLDCTGDIVSCRNGTGTVWA